MALRREPPAGAAPTTIITTLVRGRVRWQRGAAARRCGKVHVAVRVRLGPQRVQSLRRHRSTTLLVAGLVVVLLLRRLLMSVQSVVGLLELKPMLVVMRREQLLREDARLRRVMRQHWGRLLGGRGESGRPRVEGRRRREPQ